MISNKDTHWAAGHERVKETSPCWPPRVGLSPGEGRPSATITGSLLWFTVHLVIWQRAAPSGTSLGEFGSFPENARAFLDPECAVTPGIIYGNTVRMNGWWLF